jgi:hypothetical protein
VIPLLLLPPGTAVAALNAIVVKSVAIVVAEYAMFMESFACLSISMCSLVNTAAGVIFSLFSKLLVYGGVMLFTACSTEIKKTSKLPFSLGATYRGREK